MKTNFQFLVYMVVSQLRPGTGVLPHMLNESEGTLMDELRNGFQKPIVQDIVQKKDWTYKPTLYEKRNVCSKYNKQMNKSRLKEYLKSLDKEISLIVND